MSPPGIPIRRPPRCRPTIAADMSLVARPGTSQEEVPAYAGGGVPLEAMNGGQVPANLQVAVDCQWPIGSEDGTKVTFLANGGYGNHWIQAMALVDRIGSERFGLGVSDFGGGISIPLSRTTTLSFNAGRFGSTMGYATVATLGNFIRPWSPSFLISPFSDTGGSAVLEHSSFTARLALSAGRDRLPWSDNNSSLWWSAYVRWKIWKDALVLSSNYQFGPDQDNNDQDMTHLFDLSLSGRPTDNILWGIYGVYGQQAMSTPSGEQMNRWGSFEAYFDVRVSGFPVNISGVFGYIEDKGGVTTATTRRTAHGLVPNTDVRALYGTVGATFHLQEVDVLQRDGKQKPMDRWALRVDAGVMQCLSGTCGLSQTTQWTLGSQLVFAWTN